MGIWYYARLLYGIKIEKPKAKSGEISEEQDRIDEQWDDIKTWWNENSDNATDLLGVEEIEYQYDGSHPNQAGWYIFSQKWSFRTKMCSFMEVPLGPELESKLIKQFKEACEKLGVEYQEPKWYLMVESH